eukprot:3936022-Rhodomonas_salina.1
MHCPDVGGHRHGPEGWRAWGLAVRNNAEALVRRLLGEEGPVVPPASDKTLAQVSPDRCWVTCEAFRHGAAQANAARLPGTDGGVCGGGEEELCCRLSGIEEGALGGGRL